MNMWLLTFCMFGGMLLFLVADFYCRRKGLENMKKNIYLINPARGEYCGLQCFLYNILNINGKVRAALDVFSNEPPVPTNLLLQLDNIIVFSHFTGDTIKAKRRCSAQIDREMLKVIEEELSEFFVNLKIFRKIIY